MKETAVLFQELAVVSDEGDRKPFRS